MSDWKTLLGQIAPTLATALGGPLAGGAVSFLAGKVLGTDAPKEHDAALDALQQAVLGGDPKVLLAIKQADQAYQEHLQQLGVDLEKLDTRDRGSARTLAIATSIGPQVGISVLFIGGYFTLLTLLLTGRVNLPEEYKELFMTLIGVLTAGIPQVLNFWLGSSHGSQKKDDALAKAALEE